jgi:catechol 2,3-dioxygenase-like lactoylglutathione lyase family enzyme
MADEPVSPGPGFPHFALYVPTDEFDATIEAVRAAGVKMLGEPSTRVDFGTPVRAAFVTDPSGNVIELTDVGPLTRS